MTFIWVFNFRPKNFIILAKQNRSLKFHAINFHYCLTLLECCIHWKFNVFKLQNKPHKFYLHCRFSMLLLKCEYALERGKWIILLKVAIIQICFSGIYYLMLQKFCYCRVEKKTSWGWHSDTVDWAVVCNVNIPYGLWFKSQVLCLWPCHLLVCLGKQQKVAQIYRLLLPHRISLWSSGLLAQVWSGPGHYSHFICQATNKRSLSSTFSYFSLTL